jgi:RND family efflux transporter MFP subunit
MNLRRIFTIVAVVVFAAAIIFTLIKNKHKLDENKKVIDRSIIPVSVTVFSVTKADLKDSFNYAASLYANEEATISASTAGKIDNLNIELGTKVSKGQVIGKIDVNETEIKLKSAELSIEKLKADYERNKILAKGNATNANAIQDAKYDLDTKKLEAAQLSKQIANGNILSPITGEIADKKMLSGEYVNSGSAIATVIDINHLKAKVYVSETDILKLKIGQHVIVTTEAYPLKRYTGIINFISSKGDDNHNYLVQVIIENGTKFSLKAGMYVLVSFSNSTHYTSSLQIPKNALINGTKDPYVFIASHGKAIIKQLVLGKENGEYIEVVNGLTQGDSVVVSGQINAFNNCNVKVVNNK